VLPIRNLTNILQIELQMPCGYLLVIHISVAEPEPVERQLFAVAGAEVFWPGSGAGH
jgi:hypothetical protein